METVNELFCYPKQLQSPALRDKSESPVILGGTYFFSTVRLFHFSFLKFRLIQATAFLT